MENNNLVAMVKEAESTAIINGVREAGKDLFLSFEVKSIEDRKMVFNATSSGEPIKNILRKKIKLRDVIVLPVQIEDTRTKEMNWVPRTSIITLDGEIYYASSWGVYNSISRLHAIFGTLHFDEGLDVSFEEVKTKNGQTINLVLQ